MKFESKFGVGEICIVNEKTYEKPFSNRERYFGERLVKIISVIFSAGDPHPRYLVEIPLKDGGVQHCYANEGELTGDPEFDQDAGRYPPDEDQISDADWDEERIDEIGQNGGEHCDETETKLGAHKIDKSGLCVVCGEKWKVGQMITSVCKKELEDAQVISHNDQSYTRATDRSDYCGGHYGAYFEPSDLNGGPYVFMCERCGDVIEYAQKTIRECPGKQEVGK